MISDKDKLQKHNITLPKIKRNFNMCLSCQCTPTNG